MMKVFLKPKQASFNKLRQFKAKVHEKCFFVACYFLHAKCCILLYIVYIYMKCNFLENISFADCS